MRLEDLLDGFAKLNDALRQVDSKLGQLNQDVACGRDVDAQSVVNQAAVEINASLPLSVLTLDSVISKLLLYSWMTVMLVTFAEAYLSDTIDELVSQGLAASTLPGEVSQQMKRKWIKEMLRSGNPHEWLKQLKMLGVTGYCENLPDQMRSIWDRRHKIVHTSDSHASPHQFLEAVKVVTGFVSTTEEFVAVAP